METANSTLTCLISRDFQQYNITDLPSSVVPVWTVLAYVNGIAAPFTVIFNAVIIWTVLRDEELRARSYNILLAALAVSDFLVGLVVQPVYCWFCICLLTECETCLLSTFNALAIGGCMTLSLCTLMMTSVERYFAIQLPLWHRIQVTTHRVKKVVGAVWLTLPASFLILRILLNKHENLNKLPALRFAAGNILVTIYCTVKVFITAYFKNKAIKPVAASQQTQQEQNEQQKRQIQNYRQAFTLVILVVSSVMFYFPIIIVSIIQTAAGKEVTPEFKFIAQHIAVTFINLQSLINPFIMAFRIEKIRTKLKTPILSLLGGR